MGGLGLRVGLGFRDPPRIPGQALVAKVRHAKDTRACAGRQSFA